MTTAAPPAAITTTGLQLAAIDGRRGDVAAMLAGLDSAALRDVAGELLDTWLLAARFTGASRADLRDAIAADALDLAGRR